MEQKKMNANNQIKPSAPKTRVPLYSSAWLALYFVLRNEWTQPRAAGK